ncbi:MAG: hypothetical protein HY902_01100 [Deltaproteobacteria bacterium]|nr:hypothetical protein [Deltaproteobacteria bacterium]
MSKAPVRHEGETPAQQATLHALVGRFVCDTAFAKKLHKAAQSADAADLEKLLTDNGFEYIHPEVKTYLRTPGSLKSKRDAVTAHMQGQPHSLTI